MIRNRGKVLVIGDEMRIFLAVVRSLGRTGHDVYAVPFDPLSPALQSRYITRVCALPRYADDPRAWLDALRSLIKENAIDLVIPTCDRATLPLDAHREELEGVRLAIPPRAAMAHLFDKEQTRETSRGLGVPVAAGRRLEAGDTAADLVRCFGLPLVIKPRRSYWLDRLEIWGKVHICDDETALREVLVELDDPGRYLVEAHFEGSGVGVSVLARDGEIVQAFQHRRLREGRGGSSSYRMSEAVCDDLLGACRRICAEVGLTGVCMFEFRRNMRTGDWILLETNARFWGSLPLPISLGVDFPNMLYDLLIHDRVHPPVSYAVGFKSRNFVLDARNLLAGIPNLNRGTIREWSGELWDFVRQPIAWARGKERSDSFVLDDLRPAVFECATLLRSVREGRARRRSEHVRRGAKSREAVLAGDA